MSGCVICPHCGYDLEQDVEVADGPFRHHPQNGFFVDGRRLRLAPQCHVLLGTLIRAQGITIPTHVLAERLGYDGDYSTNLVSVIACKARRAIAAAGHPFPIQTVHARGLRWDRDATPSKHTRHGRELHAGASA